jgi:hypothetical protein
MTLESALTYLVALALPVWLMVEQVMIRLGRAERQGAQAESAAGSGVASSRAAEPGPVAGTTAPALTRHGGVIRRERVAPRPVATAPR